MDSAGRTLYFGTFSKVLFPGLRLGYVIVPTSLAEPFAKVGMWTHANASALEQAVVTDFIVDGHYQRHVRRMRSLYAERQSILLESLCNAGSVLTTIRAEAGLHLLGWLPEGTDDRTAAKLALREGVLVTPLSQFAIEPIVRGALMMGYAAFDPPSIVDGAKALLRALS